jgi:hypothetical protein
MKMVLVCYLNQKSGLETWKWVKTNWHEIGDVNSYGHLITSILILSDGKLFTREEYSEYNSKIVEEEQRKEREYRKKKI